MRHVLGVLGVIAASILLAVSAAMNWRFGFSLGKTEMDGQIYGAASAAADCFKALVPFFFFAAIRNRMWSQAAASAVVWVVVTAYSLTSALGHAALNRLDTAGHRAVEAATYKDLRSDLKRAEDQASWVPQHRPAQAVQSEIDGQKNQRAWTWTKGCTEVNGRFNRDYCQQFHTLSSELASAEQAVALNKRIAEIKAELGKTEGVSVMSEADPQAAVLAKLAGIVLPGVKVEDVQTALTIFVALLLEVGSAFGMYVAFAHWNLYERRVPAAPEMRPSTVDRGGPACSGSHGRSQEAAGECQRQPVDTGGIDAQASGPGKRRGALLQGKDRDDGRREPDGQRPVRGLLHLVRGERERASRTAEVRTRVRRARHSEGQDCRADPLHGRLAQVRNGRGG